VPNKTRFDSRGFYSALAATVTARKVTWKHVGAETGISPSTLSRMASGRSPDAASLTALAAWAGLNPTDFLEGKSKTAEPIAIVGKLLRQDPNLDRQGAEALEAILQAAYERLKSTKRK